MKHFISPVARLLAFLLLAGFAGQHVVAADILLEETATNAGPVLYAAGVALMQWCAPRQRATSPILVQDESYVTDNQGSRSRSSSTASASEVAVQAVAAAIERRASLSVERECDQERFCVQSCAESVPMGHNAQTIDLAHDEELYGPISDMQSDVVQQFHRTEQVYDPTHERTLQVAGHGNPWQGQQTFQQQFVQQTEYSYARCRMQGRQLGRPSRTQDMLASMPRRQGHTPRVVTPEAQQEQICYGFDDVEQVAYVPNSIAEPVAMAQQTVQGRVHRAARKKLCRAAQVYGLTQEAFDLIRRPIADEQSLEAMVRLFLNCNSEDPARRVSARMLLSAVLKNDRTGRWLRIKKDTLNLQAHYFTKNGNLACFSYDPRLPETIKKFLKDCPYDGWGARDGYEKLYALVEAEQLDPLGMFEQVREWDAGQLGLRQRFRLHRRCRALSMDDDVYEYQTLHEQILEGAYNERLLLIVQACQRGNFRTADAMAVDRPEKELLMSCHEAFCNGYGILTEYEHLESWQGLPEARKLAIASDLSAQSQMNAQLIAEAEAIQEAAEQLAHAEQLAAAEPPETVSLASPERQTSSNQSVVVSNRGDNRGGSGILPPPPSNKKKREEQNQARTEQKHGGEKPFDGVNRTWDDNKAPKDSQTILQHDKGFKKTNMREPRGAAVYKKGKRYYHRDTFHVGKAAELEVYDKTGKHLGVADPLTGHLKPNTRVPGRHLTTL